MGRDVGGPACDENPATADTLVISWERLEYCSKGKGQQTIRRLQGYLWRKRGVRDGLRDYRRARELTAQGATWRQIKTALPKSSRPLTRVQLRSVLIRESYPFFQRVAKDRQAAIPAMAAVMTADFLKTTYPTLCDDVTPERIRQLIS